MRRRGWLWFALVTLVAAAGVGALWLHRRVGVRHEAARRHDDQALGPRVRVATVGRDAAERKLTLPADVRAFLQTTLYAKTSGYLERIDVDKGDRVKKGQRLAVVASPETDQQVAQAASDLVLKEQTAARARALVKRDFIPVQEYDQAESARRVAKATLARMRALQRYEVVRAPFDGVITNRYVDAGALIPAGTNSTSGAAPLVDIADMRRIKVLVFVGQDVAPFLKLGDPATIAVEGRAPIAAKISRFVPALDPRSRTMLVEIWLDNPQLYPGSYVRVTLQVAAPPLPRVPASAVAMRGGQLVAGVVRDGKLRLVPVTLGLDDGKTVQVQSGLEPGWKVALNLPPELRDGTAVQPVETPAVQGR